MDWKQVILEIQAGGLSQTEIGERIGRSQAWVCAVATGKYKDVRWSDGKALLALRDQPPRPSQEGGGVMEQHSIPTIRIGADGYVAGMSGHAPEAPGPVFTLRTAEMNLDIYADGRVDGLPEGAKAMMRNSIWPLLHCYEAALWRMSAPNADPAAIAADALQGVSLVFDSKVLKALAAGELMNTSVPESGLNSVRMDASGANNSAGDSMSLSVNASFPSGK